MLGIASHQLVYVTMPKIWYKVSSIRKSKHCMSLETVGDEYSLVKCCRRNDKELKKGAGHKLLRTRHLWDNYLELEAYIRSTTANEIYKLDRKVPKTVMSDKTSDISQFCELEWFKWVVF